MVVKRNNIAINLSWFDSVILEHLYKTRQVPSRSEGIRKVVKRYLALTKRVVKHICMSMHSSEGSEIEMDDPHSETFEFTIHQLPNAKDDCCTTIKNLYLREGSPAKLKTITVHIDDRMLREINELLECGLFTTRSEMFRHAFYSFREQVVGFKNTSLPPQDGNRDPVIDMRTIVF